MKVCPEFMTNKTFSSDKEGKRNRDVLELGIVTRKDEILTLSTVATPHICDPVHMQHFSSFKNVCEHL